MKEVLRACTKDSASRVPEMSLDAFYKSIHSLMEKKLWPITIGLINIRDPA